MRYSLLKSLIVVILSITLVACTNNQTKENNLNTQDQVSSIDENNEKTDEKEEAVNTEASGSK